MANLDVSTKHIAKIARVSSLKMTHASKASHIASCLSVIDVLTVALVEKFSSKNPDTYDVLLSKGHAAAALYSVLDAVGELGLPLDSYCHDESPLYGHVNHHASPHIPLSTGSLGHGLPFGLGIALAKKLNGIKQKTVVIMSDGECDEGTTWESAMIANHHKLDQLVAVIDRNKIQSLGNTEDVLKLEPFKEKWIAFGWEVRDIDGHDHDEILNALKKQSDRPVCIIANTVKGKGVHFMEDSVAWHYKSPNDEELDRAIELVVQSK
jgi:transketolase